MAAFSQQALWELLDRSNLPFRTPIRDLLAAYGREPSKWSEGLDYCPLPGAIPGLNTSWFVAVRDVTDHLRAPIELLGYLQTSSVAEENFLEAVERLDAYFGEGRDISGANMLGLEWGGKYCKVTARCFPPSRNRSPGLNLRHQRIPGSKTECAITICADWWPTVPEAEKRALLEYARDPTLERRVHGDPTWRPVPAGIDATPGIGISCDMVVCVSADRRYLAIPLTQLTCVSHDILTPAKGGGGSWVTLRYTQAGRRHDGNLIILGGKFDDPAHPALACSMADRLGLPMKKSSFADC